MDNIAEKEISFYLGMLGENYHLAPFVGFALKISDKVYVSKDVALLQEMPLKGILENQTIKRTYSI